MMRPRRVVVACWIGLLTIGLLASQAGAASLAADVAKAWEQQKALILRTAEAMPEESFGYKPTEAQRTFGEQLLHIAGSHSFLMGFAGSGLEGPEFSLGNFATFGLEAATKAEFLAHLERGFDHGTAVIAAFDDAAMLEEVQGPPWVGKVTRAGMFQFILGHNMDIYGQLVVYLRLEGVTPPASQR